MIIKINKFVVILFGDGNVYPSQCNWIHPRSGELYIFNTKVTFSPLTAWDGKNVKKNACFLKHLRHQIDKEIGDKSQTLISDLSPPNLPETSFNCSMKSLPVMSATEFGSIFVISSKSGSLSTDTLYKLFFSWCTIFFKWTRSTSGLSVVSAELLRVVMVT